jgi:hypothetical protein
MDSSAFDRLTRLFGNSTGRRAALATTAATGLAALTASTAGAQQNGDLEADRRRRKGKGKRRGRRGRRGHQGPPGPPLGAFIEVVEEDCQVDGAIGQVLACEADCPTGYVASGGGFNVGEVLETLGTVRHSEPILDGGRPVGWSVSIEFFDVGQDFDYTAYAICVPG